MVSFSVPSQDAMAPLKRFSCSYSVNILIVQNSSSNVPKVLGILTIITCLDVACHAVAIGRFVNLMAIQNNSHILVRTIHDTRNLLKLGNAYKIIMQYHWGASDVHTAALVFAIPEASVLGFVLLLRIAHLIFRVY